VLQRTVTLSAQQDYSFNFEIDESRVKCGFPAPIEIEIHNRFENAEPTIKTTSRRLIIDSMRRNRRSLSNGIQESDSQSKTNNEQETSAPRGIVIGLQITLKRN
jgi:hypothetical protein